MHLTPWYKNVQYFFAVARYKAVCMLHRLCSCVICAKECTGTLCKTCAAKFVPYASCGVTCTACGGLLNVSNVCRFCEKIRSVNAEQNATEVTPEARVVRMFSTWLYDENTRALFLAYKKTGIHIVFYALSYMVYQSFKEAMDFVHVRVNADDENVCIVPVPAHPKHQRALGFSHTEKIAKYLAFLCGYKYASVLRRTQSHMQKELNVSQRWQNMHKALYVKKGYSKTSALKNVRVIVLFDDVIATGATMHAGYEIMQDVFPNALVVGLSLCRVENSKVENK